MTLVAYADLDDDPLVQAARAAGEGSAEGRARLERVLFLEPGGLASAVARRVVASTGPFARAARGEQLDRGRLAVAAVDLAALDLLAHAPIDLRPGGTTQPERGEYGSLVARLAAGPGWATYAADLGAFHRREGVGALATHRVLRFDRAGLHGVARPDPITLADLTGREELREPLLEDLAAFTSGEPTNDALLYGPPGTGKSATVRACAAAFADRSLRLIQVAREELDAIDGLFDLVAGEGPWCLLYLDDLVFDDDGRADRALRAALEGGVVGRPPNVLVWATSNRLNLTHQTHSERADEIDDGEARGEKVALANRFGRRVRFDVRGEDWYLAIVRRLVTARLGNVPDGCIDAALRYARTGPGPTPRTAQHFAASYRHGSDERA